MSYPICEYCGATLDYGEKCDCGLTEKPKDTKTYTAPIKFKIPRAKKGKKNEN